MKAVIDAFSWLEADDERVREWCADQQRRTDEFFAGLPDQSRIGELLREVHEVGSISRRVVRRHREFFARRAPGDDVAKIWMVQRSGDRSGDIESVAFDPAMHVDGRSPVLSTWSVSPSGALIAAQVATDGDEKAALFVAAVGAKALLREPIKGTRYSPVAWSGDDGIFYLLSQPSGKPGEKHLHYLALSGSAARSVQVELPVVAPAYGLQCSHRGRWLCLVASWDAMRGEAWTAQVSAVLSGRASFRRVYQGNRCLARFDSRGRLWILGERECGSARFVRVDPTDGFESNVTIEMPEGSISEFVPVPAPSDEGDDQEWLVSSWIVEASHVLAIHSARDGRLLKALAPIKMSTISGLAGPVGNRQSVGYTIVGYAAPAAAFELDLGSGQMAVRRAASNPVDLSEVIISHHRFKCDDGTDVGIVLLRHRRRRHEPRPTLLYVYGGFGVPLTPRFLGVPLAWVRLGGTYAIVQARGGGERGRGWHVAGAGENKPRAVDDVCAAAGWLFADGVTPSGALAAEGASNGGLVIAAAITRRPELFAAAVITSPLTDMLRYQDFGLGSLWRSEYGVSTDPGQRDVLLSYSPYHNVVRGRSYPAVLVDIRTADERVHPMHARKFVAALQQVCASGRVFLDCVGDAGHGLVTPSQARHSGMRKVGFAAYWTGLEQGPLEVGA